jgi:hypothetical protein
MACWPGEATVIRKPERLLAVAAGVVLTANLYAVPALATSPRATDVGGAVLGLWALAQVVRGRIAAPRLAALGLLSLAPAVWLFFGLMGGDGPTAVMTGRFLLAVPWALALMAIADRKGGGDDLALGLLIGSMVNVAVILAQVAGLEHLLAAAGLSSRSADYGHYVNQQVRLPGLHGNHNASASVISLVVPAGFYLYFRGRLRLAALLAALLALMLAIALTSTRGPLLAAVASAAFAMAVGRRVGASVVIGAVALAVVVPLVVVYGPPGGWARWRNTEALVNNASERQASWVGSVELSLEHPQGLGITEGHRLLTERTGIRATHNAFLQAALAWSLPFALLLLAGLGAAVVRGALQPGEGLLLRSVLAFHLCGLFLFEEHLNNPTFVVLAVWLAAAGVLPEVRSGRSRAG